MYDRWTMYAYDASGSVWETEDLAIDGFKVTKSSDDFITVEVERDYDDIAILRISADNGSVVDVTE